MFFLVRMKLKSGDRARCLVTHVRPGNIEEVLEEGEIAWNDRLPEHTRGWVIPADPQPGDQIRFEMVEVAPIGSDGAAYEWEAKLCEANGPAKADQGENPGIFAVHVPAQTAEDIAECPDAEVQTVRALKDGPRRFCWTIEKAA